MRKYHKPALAAINVMAMLAASAAVTLGLLSCDKSPAGPSPSDPPPSVESILVGAGDVADCANGQPNATAMLLDSISGTVFVAGDTVYPLGSTERYQNCYEPTWGRHKARTRPVPGNHEYDVAGAGPYFAYFGTNAGPPGAGYYSYTLSSWHVIGLNSMLPVGQGSAQYQWLTEELATSSLRCTVAYWHHPRFSSGPNGDSPFMQDVWRLLYERGVEVVINGHDHTYERFAQLDAAGRLDAQRGIRQFVVGTGGAPLYSFAHTHPASEARASVHGVLKLRLRPDQYDWEFVPAAAGSFSDIGGGFCH